MSTITRELAKLFRKITNSEIDAEGNAHVVLSPADSLLINNARIALASLEAEPVCVIDQSNLDYLKSGSDADVWPASRAEMGDVLLYRSATPAPVSVPAAMEMDDDFDSAFEHGKAVGWNAYRAAMLQGAEQQNRQQNIPENIPATQFKPVADLYGLTSPTGSETSFTFDAVEARDFIDGGWSCQEYVELERYQNAVAGNSPVIPDDVRRMDWLVSKTVDVREPMVYGSHSLFWSQTITDEEDDYHATKLREQIDAAMEAEQAAAPQQEVTQALAKGMERYGDAMQKLADSGD